MRWVELMWASLWFFEVIGNFKFISKKYKENNEKRNGKCVQRQIKSAVENKHPCRGEVGVDGRNDIKLIFLKFFYHLYFQFLFKIFFSCF